MWSHYIGDVENIILPAPIKNFIYTSQQASFICWIFMAVLLQGVWRQLFKTQSHKKADMSKSQ